MTPTKLMRCAAGAVCVLAIAAATASAATAPGDTTYAGTTAESTKVKLTVGTAGNATVFKIAKTQATCDQGRLDTEAATFKRFDVSDPGEFSDKRKSSTQDGSYVLKDTFELTGALAADQSSWTGTYDKTTKVLKNGHKFDTCVLSTTWEAS
jgi:hypothetical protein